MSNPTVTFGNSISQPFDPSVERVSWGMLTFADKEFYTYPVNGYSSFDPSGRGNEFYYFLPLSKALDRKPAFITQQLVDSGWDELPSGVFSANNSIIPKLMVPNTHLVDNGSGSDSVFNAVSPSDDSVRYFNWDLAPSSSWEPLDWVLRSGGSVGSKYFINDYKVNTEEDISISVQLQNDGGHPEGYWISGDNGELVVEGAFCIVLNVVPTFSSQTSDPEASSEKKWSVSFDFGDVSMVLTDNNSLRVTIDGEDDGNTTQVQVAQLQGGDAPPQSDYFNQGKTFLIAVYPIWNGIIVQSGIQQSKNVVNVSSKFCPKLNSAGIFDSEYADEFDTENPSAVEVGVGSGDSSVIVDFGEEMNVTSENCRYGLAYIPCFFPESCYFDYWFASPVSSDDSTVIYDYDIYPIWTANGTSTEFDSSDDVEQTSYEADDEGSSYFKYNFNMETLKPVRRSGEVFGAYIRTKETSQYPVDNNNGSFYLNWEGGTPAGGGGSWQDYVTSVSVQIGLDGTSGSVTLDKYGLAGQSAEAIQKIGALTLSASGGYGTVGGDLFKGIANGINDSRSSDDDTWTIPLVGLEKKLEDIVLINVPFFDGYKLGRVIRFLTRYGGINSDFRNAPLTWSESFRLNSSTDISAPIVDFKTGTSVQDALNEIMEMTLHTYVVRDGKIYFYQLSPDDGLPVYLGTDWSTSYPDTKVVNRSGDPDFDDLRNEIIVVGLQRSLQEGTDIADIPLIPRIIARSNATTPDVPWARSMVFGLNGYVTDTEMEDIYDKMSAVTRVYELIGRTSIPGNASIRPYDRWGNYVITSVSHNIDLSSKSWTTDLEFATGRS